MLDCKVDVTDTDMPVELDECIAEHKRFYYLDQHQIYIRIVKHVLLMLEKDLLTDNEGNTLTKESEEVKKYFESEEFRLA